MLTGSGRTLETSCWLSGRADAGRRVVDLIERSAGASRLSTGWDVTC